MYKGLCSKLMLCIGIGTTSCLQLQNKLRIRHRPKSAYNKEVLFSLL